MPVARDAGPRGQGAVHRLSGSAAPSGGPSEDLHAERGKAQVQNGELPRGVVFYFRSTQIFHRYCFVSQIFLLSQCPTQDRQKV